MKAKEPSPARLLRDRVEAMYRAGQRVAFVTDATSMPDKVLLAMATPFGSWVMAIDRAEVGGPADMHRIAAALGIPIKPQGSTTKTQRKTQC